MHRTITANLDAEPGTVWDHLAVLDGYPDWLDIVSVAERDLDASDPTWFVTLRAKIGPFARSKRLRMVRTLADRPHQIRFERAETDGREHSPWTLDVAIAAADAGSDVTVELRYEGGLWTAPLEAVLGSQVDDAVPRLQQQLRSA